ncbi:uncharacterized protein LOC135826500 [Sycon ciliatum]|uniref:uncharacterized protein LOC135826500 n=1 Tax=Sycon ciliatum TaxID=27933 RepID=UPI0031F681A8
MIHSLFLTFLCLLAMRSSDAQAYETSQSQGAADCLELLLLRSGVPLDKAIVYRQNLASLGFDLPRIESADEKLLAFIFEKNAQHATAVQGCLGGTLAACVDYSPCGTDGQCLVSSDSSGYHCDCSPFTTGMFCEEDTTLQTLNTSVKMVTLSTVANSMKLAALGARVADLEEHHDECEQALVGYAFNSRYHNFIDNNDHAQLASITYVKKRADTLLKVSYSANIRVIGGGVNGGRAARWFVKIDGQECSDPTLVDIWYYRTDTENIHIPSDLKGICRGTSDGRIGAGSHTITVHVGESPIDNYPLGRTSNGYGSTQLLEVQEICPPF